jgi:hypothetical protein
VKIYPDKGHWMDGLDAVALEWMAQYDRQPLPDRVVWYQDDVTHDRFYWLAVDPEDARAGVEVTVQRSGQQFLVTNSAPVTLRIQLNDELVDMDQPVQVRRGDQILFEQVAARTIAHLVQSLASRADRRSMFSGQAVVEVPLAE